MLFSSLVFIFIFLPIVFIVSRFLNIKWQNVFLLLASLVFYAWGEPIYVFLMLFSILINYIAGLVIDSFKYNLVLKKIFLAFFIIIDVLILGYFKYANLFFGTNIALPIGISFFTFQAMSYIIDVYRGEADCQKNIINIALYISFFPQLIAGPIVKYKDIDEQITNRKVDIEKLSFGIRRFIYGLAKKVIIANSLANVVDTIVSKMPVQSYGMITSWVIALFYTLQIYYDFSGYSDMAIGLGKMFGFDFLENFNYPYLSRSITEFWRRWHISLSTWFKEYVYIPLGGNRKGKFRTYINLIIVFALTGFWHGASWNFLAWGLMHGFFMLVERIFLKKVLDKIYIFNHIYTIFIVCITFVIFRFENIIDGLYIIHRLINPKFLSFDMDLSSLLNSYNMTIFYIAIIFSGPFQAIFKYLINKLLHINIENYKLCFVENIFLLTIFLYSITELVSSTYNPFIYFRF